MTNSLKRQWMDFLSTKRKVIPLSIVRMLYGLLLLAYFVLLFPNRDFLFGNDAGYYPTEYVNTSSSVLREWLRLFDSYRFVDALFFVGMLSAFTFTIGFLTKLSHVLLLCCFFLLEGRNPLLFDAGDEFVQLALIYLLFCRLNGFGAVDNLLFKKRRADNVYLNIVHNLGVIAVIAQFLLIYAVSGVAKLAGPMWRDGTAMYYIGHADLFSIVDPVTERIVSGPQVSAVLTYSAMLFQLAFPVLVFVRKARPWILAAACCFHAGIAVQFGIAYFSLIMLVFEVMFFSDEAWRRGMGAARGRLERLLDAAGIRHADANSGRQLIRPRGGGAARTDAPNTE